MMARDKETAWSETVARLLISGRNAGEAAEAAAAAGVPAVSAVAIAHEMVSHPLLTVAKEHWIRLQCREWLLAVRASLDTARHEFDSVDELPSISRGEFLSSYYFLNRPLILRKAASQWRAVSRWTREYLIQACGDEFVEVMTNRDAASVPHQNTSDRLKQTVRFADFVNRVFTSGPSNDYYMVSRNGFFERHDTRTLLSDVDSLPFVDTRAPGDGVRMWFGPAGTVTPLHYDDRNLVFAQILGRKHFRLYSPFFSEFMRQRQRWYARVDPRDARPPAGVSSPREMRLSLDPGDVLFIPVGWWHAVNAVDVSISLTFVEFGVLNAFERR